MLLLLWIVYLVAVPLYAWTKVEKVDFEPGGSRPDDQPGTTYLLVGSDSRAGLSKEERKRARHRQRRRTAHRHDHAAAHRLRAQPADVDPPRLAGRDPGHGTTKINAAYAYGGAKLLTRTIESETGIRVDEYVEIGLGGLAGVVDAVGGIEICPTQNMKDKLAKLDIEKGCQEVDGATALGYARSRHTSGIGDIDRVKHQREVVAAVGDKVLSPWTFINPVALLATLDGGARTSSPSARAPARCRPASGPRR